MFVPQHRDRRDDEREDALRRQSVAAAGELGGTGRPAL